MEYHVYVSRGGRAYRIFSDAELARRFHLARSRYRPVAIGFGTMAEAEQYVNRRAVAGDDDPEPPRPTGKRK